MTTEQPDFAPSQASGPAPAASPASAPVSATKRKRGRRWLVPVIVAAVLLAGAGTAWAVLRPRATTVGVGDTTVLTTGTLTDSISATGTVAAATSAKVYSTLTYQVSHVNVELGQAVRAGDQLAQLDTATIDKQIASKKASMTQSQASAAASLAAAQNKYNAAASAVRNGTNSSLVNAQTSVTTAYDNWQKAVKTYEDAKAALDDGNNSQLVSAQTAVDNAKASLTNAQYNEKKARDAWEAAGKPAYPDATKVALDQAVNALDAAETAYDNARSAYEASANGADNTLSDYSAAADQAHDAYVNAQKALSAAQTSAQTDLQTSADAVKSSQASGRQDAAVTDLAGLLTDKASATITSPVDGTVTAVNATVGAPASGVLFVVESTDRLKVSSSVNEYDSGTVKPGMKVLISSDATRDAVYQGTVTSVAPASAKDASGKTVTGSDIQYATEIDVNSTGTGLRIGMNARVQYVVGQAESVLSVPTDSVFTDAQGADAVLALTKRLDGQYTIEQIAVTKGLENDVDVVISGDRVSEGLRVLNTPAKYKAGAVVTLSGV